MEYKFRGFDATGQKGWVYGDLVHNQKVTRTGLEPRVMVGGYEVVPESVGLCTGLVNYIGNPVYEGDILLLHLENFTVRGKVAYDNFHGCFVFRDLEDEHKSTAFLGIVPKDIEVIGNVFENKDLLNNKNN